jgi:hypothetical protein
MSVRLAQSSFKAARSPVFSPLYNALMTTSEAAGGSATTDVMLMLRAAGKKAFFPSTNPATGWWQDSAGTTQAALEQPVGRITDLSGNGYHATQATSLNRPTYTQRVNQAQRTEDNTNAAWTKTQATAPSTSTLLATAGTGTIPTINISSLTNAISTPLRYCFYAQAGTHSTIQVYVSSQAADYANINLATGASQAFGGMTISVVADGAGWTITADFTIGAANRLPAVMLTGTYAATRAQTWNPVGTESATITKHDIRLQAFSAMNLPAYQRVGNGTAGVADYDTAGFRPMLYFDGTSDALATSAIDLTGTDQIMALCNVLKVSDAATGMVYETGNTAPVGSMYITAPQSAGIAGYGASSRGTTQKTAIYNNAAVGAPNLACLRHEADISTPVLTLYRNGVSIATDGTTQGTGNYGNHALYIGARAGTSLWFKGYMIPGPLLDTTGIPSALLDQMAREQAALWGVAI